MDFSQTVHSFARLTRSQRSITVEQTVPTYFALLAATNTSAIASGSDDTAKSSDNATNSGSDSAENTTQSSSTGDVPTNNTETETSLDNSTAAKSDSFDNTPAESSAESQDQTEGTESQTRTFVIHGQFSIILQLSLILISFSGQSDANATEATTAETTSTTETISKTTVL